MSAHITRSRVVAGATAVLALAVVTGCGGAKESPASTQATKAPSVSQAPTKSEAPSGTATNAPVKGAPEGKSGTILKFGEVANVEVGNQDKWIGGLKVTSLEKAPASVYKKYGIRADAGTLYYLRYNVTHVSVKTKFPATGFSVRLKPVTATGQKVSSIAGMQWSGCSTHAFAANGDRDQAAETLKIGQTATNMCQPFLVDKGTLTQVVHSTYDFAKREDHTFTWG